MSCETWLPVEGFPDYEVSDKGNVRTYKRRSASAEVPMLMNPMDFNGYKHVYLHEGHLRRWGQGGRGKKKRVHRLVLEAFIGLCPKGKECRHLDGNPSNNKLENLTWGTSKENASDQFRHGTRPFRRRCMES